VGGGFVPPVGKKNPAPRWIADLVCHVRVFGKLLGSRGKEWQKHRSDRKAGKRKSDIRKNGK